MQSEIFVLPCAASLTLHNVIFDLKIKSILVTYITMYCRAMLPLVFVQGGEVLASDYGDDMVVLIV